MRIVTESGVHTTTFDNGALLAVSRGGTVFRANPTAAAMWITIMDLDGDLEQTATVIATRYGIPPERARADIITLIERLREAQLIRWRS